MAPLKRCVVMGGAHAQGSAGNASGADISAAYMFKSSAAPKGGS